jgi:TatA/E family protein of Tat protein translocase
VFEGLFAPMHLLVIGVVALLVLGPDRLPEVAREVGKAVRIVSKFREQLTADVHRALDLDASTEPGPKLQSPGAGPRSTTDGSAPGQAPSRFRAPPTRQ